MRAWEIGSAAFFVYLALMPAVRRAAMAGRRRAIVTAAAGLLLTLVSRRIGYSPILHDWLLPPILLVIAYWGSGALFTAPMPRVEQWLRALDRSLRIRPLAAMAPRPLAEYLEIAYSGIYPLMPVALWISMANGGTAVRFWTVILLTDYVCFGCLPWIQSRPPRAMEPDPPWRSRWRTVNLQLLDASSIGANTFPSGHAAEALACALLVIGAPWPLVTWMFVNAAAISAGAVFGRYHYAADAVAGWMVALVVWMVV